MAYPIQTCFALFIIYLQIMDGILYFKIRTRGPLDSGILARNQTNSDLLTPKTSQIFHSGYVFDSLPVKKIMVGQIVSSSSSRTRISRETFLLLFYFLFRLIIFAHH